MNETLAGRVRARAGGRWEYCRRLSSPRDLAFEIDHIIARQHRGPTVLENLALACFHCNSHKGPNLSGFDLVTRRVVRLFHPRKDRWSDHFEWDGPLLLGRTSRGRVTIQVLKINDPDAVVIREMLIEDGLFP